MNANLRSACLSAALLCAFSSSAHSESSNVEWLDDAQGCKVSNPQSQQAESIKWSGRCKGGFADGPGTVSWFLEGKANGSTSGTFREGKLIGKGYIILPQSAYALESFPDRDFGSRSAEPNVSRLDGEFHNDQLIGDGIITKPNGQQIIVNQIDGKMVRKNDVAPAKAMPVRALEQ